MSLKLSLFYTDLKLPTESAESDNNSTITVVVAVLVSILALLTVMAAFTIIIVITCFVKKKKERKILNLPNHVYESVLQPPSTLVTFSKLSNLDADLYDKVKTTSCSTATQFELTDNEA